MNRTFKRKAAVCLLCCALWGCGEAAESADIETEFLSEDHTSSESVSCGTEESLSGRSEKLLSCDFYDERTFAVHDKISEPYDIEGRLLGGVVTHHLLAGKMIAGFFKSAAKNRGDEIETVVIIAPMHYPEEDMFCTSSLSWQTPFGKAETDREITERLVSELGAAEDSEMLVHDHSASSLLPYLKYYLPDAKVACLLISGRADKAAPKKTAELLKDISEDKNCLFVFSIDFSHYLPPEKTEEMDKITLEAVLSRDLESIAEMTDDNMDSPRCMCTFLELMDMLDGTVHEADHGNSLSMSDVPYTKATFGEGLTSYYVFTGTYAIDNE